MFQTLLKVKIVFIETSKFKNNATERPRSHCVLKQGQCYRNSRWHWSGAVNLLLIVTTRTRNLMLLKRTKYACIFALKNYK